MSVTRSIVIPCWNEAQSLPALIRRFESLRKPSSDWEILLVDNGSTDDTKAVLAEELGQPAREFIRVVEVPAPNVGYGHGIMTGLRAARGSLLAWTHADGQTPPEDVLRAFELLSAAADPQRTFVKGRRQARRALLTFGMEVAAVLFLRQHLVDINAQPKAFPRRLLELVVSPPDDLSLDLYFYHLAKKHRFEVLTFPVDFRRRTHGASRWAFSLKSRGRHIARTLRFMRALRGQR